MKTLLVAVLALALSPALALAGGGSKQNGTLQVRDNSASTTDSLAVIVDPPAGFTITTAAAFTAAGGKIVGPGLNSLAVFSNLKAGSHTVVAAFVNLQTSNVGTTSTSPVTIYKGQTAAIHVDEAGGTTTTAGAATIVLAP